MSKPVKAMLRRELTRRLEGSDSLVVLSLAGVDGIRTNQLRSELRAKGVHVTVVKNAVARQALKEVGLESVDELVTGPCAFATGGDSVVAVVRDLLATGKQLPALQLRGALMEGAVYGSDRIEELSKLPTLPEALSKLAGVILAAGSRLAAAVKGPGGTLGGILKALEERGGEEAPTAA